MAMSPQAASLARRAPAHHMSRRATGGLLQDGAVGYDSAVWHAHAIPVKLK